jgi:hypothetical protein
VVEPRLPALMTETMNSRWDRKPFAGSFARFGASTETGAFRSFEAATFSRSFRCSAATICSS